MARAAGINDELNSIWQKCRVGRRMCV